MPVKNMLIVQASSRQEESLTREISGFLASSLQDSRGYEVKIRDLESTDLPLIDSAMVNSFFTPLERLTGEQKELQKESMQLIEELKWADAILIATPIYNFSVPARLKAWIDLVCRAGLTFKYSESGPVGLLNIEKAFLVVASGGTPIGSEIDFASSYLRHLMNFIGIHEVELIKADGSKNARDDIIANSRQQISRLLAA